MRAEIMFAAGAAAIVSFAACGSALAAAPLAGYSQLPGDSGASLSFANGTLATPTGGEAVQFYFSAPGLPGGDLDALFTFNAATTAAAYQAGPPDNQYDFLPDLSGTFSFVYTGATPLVIGTQSYGAGTTLLSGSFADSTLSGADSGTTANESDSRFAGGTVDLASGISEIQFSSGGDQSFVLALDSVVPAFAVSGSTIFPFTATSTGTFAADSTISGAAGGVPETGAWITLILGLGVAGAQIRSRKANLAKG